MAKHRRSSSRSSSKPAARDPAPDPAGILLIDKPQGMTSHDVVHRVRRTFSYRKVGHAGTLDPLATGVLVLLIGKATRSQRHFLEGDKAYEATCRLGASTSTQDADGEVTARAEGVVGVSDEALEAALARFRGEIEQLPPMVSAIKHRGRPLYKYARQGVEIEREPRQVRILQLEVFGREGADVRLRIVCSKGTYVRTICHDLGEALGCHGHLAALRRIRAGPFSVAECLPLEEVLSLRPAELPDVLKLVSEVLPDTI